MYKFLLVFVLLISSISFSCSEDSTQTEKQDNSKVNMKTELNNFLLDKEWCVKDEFLGDTLAVTFTEIKGDTYKEKGYFVGSEESKSSPNISESTIVMTGPKEFVRIGTALDKENNIEHWAKIWLKIIDNNSFEEYKSIHRYKDLDTGEIETVTNDEDGLIFKVCPN